MTRKKARFRVEGGKLDRTIPTVGTVTIENGIFSIRPFRRRHVYAVPLSVVADIVIARIISTEISERAAKRQKFAYRKKETR